MISLPVQQTMNPRQIISDVTAALRPAALTVTLLGRVETWVDRQQNNLNKHFIDKKVPLSYGNRPMLFYIPIYTLERSNVIHTPRDTFSFSYPTHIPAIILRCFLCSRSVMVESALRRQRKPQANQP